MVLGTLAVLLVMGATIATVMRHEFRLSRVEAEAEQGRILEESAFNEAAKLAEGSSTWPDLPAALEAPCTPQPPYPSYCLDAFARTPYEDDEYGFRVHEVIPLRVRWRLSAGAATGELTGWVMLFAGEVSGLIPFRGVCDPPTTVGDPSPCAFGG